MKLQGRYWRDNEDIVNLGDYVTELLLQAFGYEYVSYPAPEPVANPGECLFAVGTLLDADWFQRVPGKIVVWGSGYWGDPRFALRQLRNCRITAVRGPLTRRELNIREVAMGDPALLLPHFYALEREFHAPVLYVPHFHNYSEENIQQRLEATHADEFLSVRVRRSKCLTVLKRLVSAKFVLTNSLHAAILAQAYETPWALCLSGNDALNLPLKWLDWFEYLGTPLHAVPNLTEGLKWWEHTGQHLAIPSLQPLATAFPYPILSESARCVIAAVK